LLNSVGVYVGLMGARSAHTLQPQVCRLPLTPFHQQRMTHYAFTHTNHVDDTLGFRCRVYPAPRVLLNSLTAHTSCLVYVCLCTCLQAARSYFLGLCGVGSLWILLRIVWVRPLTLIRFLFVLPRHSFHPLPFFFTLIPPHPCLCSYVVSCCALCVCLCVSLYVLLCVRSCARSSPLYVCSCLCLRRCGVCRRGTTRRWARPPSPPRRRTARRTRRRRTR
jgi:hypothetical protein